MTSEKLGKYIQRYMVDPEIFEKEVSNFRNIIQWGKRDV
jgi:hypothetical protein